MTVDMRQFHAVFFEESFEGLETMESGLLGLEPGAAEAPDPETINAIFRAAHSIKGGSGTFGFTEVSAFTHVMETLLDEVRDGTRRIDRGGVDLLLSAVDCLRVMLTAVRDESSYDTDRVAEVQGELEALLGHADDGGPGDARTSDDGQPEAAHVVRFAPFPDLLRTGNEPLRMLRELDDLIHDAGTGELAVTADLGALPPLAELDPEQIHLSWTIEVPAGVTREQIAEVFEWVEDECDLAIEQADVGEPAPPEVTPVAASSAPETPSAPKPRPDAARRDGGRPAAGNETSIRVGTQKIDALIDKVGELVITQSMLTQLGDELDGAEFDLFRDGLAQLQRNTRDLQDNVMRIRMLPISFSFNRFPRLIHDLSGRLGKKVELQISGEQTELDKTVLEKIGDPLVHLVRNSLDHGLEEPEARIAAGKPEVGTIQLDAFHQGGNIVVKISDDGAGLDRDRIASKALANGLIESAEGLSDEELYQLIFEPGFSTASEVSDVSGRGVGMDVVRRNILELGGKIEIASEPGAGTSITIRLPLTLAILDGQLVRVGDQTYIIPIVSILESLQVQDDLVSEVAGHSELYRLRDEYIPVIRLYRSFGIAPRSVDLRDGLLVIVEGDGRKAGIFVDDLLGQQQVVIKSLETNFRPVPGLSGATILGDGKVAMILDVAALVSGTRVHGATPARRDGDAWSGRAA